MKRIYASLLLLAGACTGAFAQRHCDVEVLPLIGPADGSNYSCNGTVVSGYYFINHGPDPIMPTDSFLIFDPNIDQGSEGAIYNDISSFYYYWGYPTGQVLNGYVGEGENAERAPTVQINPGDTIIYYQWNDTITRLCALIKTDTSVTSVDGDPMDYYVFTPEGQVPPNGEYLWLARFAGFYNSTDVVDTVFDNNYKFNSINLGCATGINDVKYNKVNLTVYPNPTNNAINFNYTFAKAAIVTARVMDLTGRTVKAVNLGKAVPGVNQFKVDVNELPIGTYLLEFTAGDIKGISKFTKK